MRCPKCGFEQPQSDECRACGIIIEKFNNKPVRSPAAAKPLSPVKHEPSSSASIQTLAVSVAVIFLFGLAAFNFWKTRPVAHPPGITAPDSPAQGETETALFQFKDYRIIPLADFQLTARVLGKKKYYFGRESDLAPYDLAFGWGPMSDGSVLDEIEFRQSNRFYFWSAERYPIPRKEIETHSANMHLIPSTGSVLTEIKRARVGDNVALAGCLVRVEASDGWRWKSSLTRSDTGNGACELIYVDTFEIE